MTVGLNYKRYLKSPAWQVKRQQVFNYYGKACFACRTRIGPIQVHHLTYEHLGRERLDELRPLCVRCHRDVTALHWKLGKRKYTGRQVFAVFMKTKRKG